MVRDGLSVRGVINVMLPSSARVNKHVGQFESLIEDEWIAWVTRVVGPRSADDVGPMAVGRVAVA